jgi:hypothetical protein
MARGAWFFGVLREAGSYRVVAAGPMEGRVRRALDGYTNPTMVVTESDLPSLGVSEREWRPWLPEGQAAAGESRTAPEAPGAAGAAGAAGAPRVPGRQA